MCNIFFVNIFFPCHLSNHRRVVMKAKKLLNKLNFLNCKLLIGRNEFESCCMYRKLLVCVARSLDGFSFEKFFTFIAFYDDDMDRCYDNFMLFETINAARKAKEVKWLAMNGLGD